MKNIFSASPRLCAIIKHKENGKSGFSLVEVTLALMVISIGVLALFSLFPGGLDQSIRAEGDTYASLFAQEVFAALRNEARTDWAALGNSDFPVASTNMWDNTMDLRVRAGTNVYTNAFINLRLNPTDPPIVNYALRYQLEITTNLSLNAKKIWLRVWDGERGGVDSPHSFYTEIYKHQHSGF